MTTQSDTSALPFMSTGGARYAPATQPKAGRVKLASRLRHIWGEVMGYFADLRNFRDPAAINRKGPNAR